MLGYTWRERLADWISGGTISAETKRALHAIRLYEGSAAQRNHYYLALSRIERATRDGKSGTARKVNRMAKEALK